MSFDGVLYVVVIEDRVPGMFAMAEAAFSGWEQELAEVVVHTAGIVLGPVYHHDCFSAQIVFE